MAKDFKARPALEPQQARELVASLDRRGFLEELGKLTASVSSDPGNPGSYAAGRRRRITISRGRLDTGPRA